MLIGSPSAFKTKQKAHAGFVQSAEVARECNANPLLDDIRRTGRVAISGGPDDPKQPTAKAKNGKK